MIKPITSHRISWDRIGAILGWVALIVQLILMLQKREAGVGETLLRFFTYFTVLTNSLLAAYFTMRATGTRNWLTGPGALTAITAFILVVGIVYQIILRGIWELEGLDRVVDELLHSLLPLYGFVYWFLFAERADFNFRPIVPWLIYPLLYFALVIFHGAYSGFYPYTFVNVDRLGYPAVFLNSGLMTGFALLLIALLIGIGRWKSRDRREG